MVKPNPLFITAAIVWSLGTAQAQLAPPSHPAVQEFQREALLVLGLLMGHPEILPELDRSRIENLLGTVRIETTTEDLNCLTAFAGADQVREVSTAAVCNWPEDRLIRIQPTRWDALTDACRRRTLVLHEVLPMLGLEDPSYQRSIRALRRMDPACGAAALASAAPAMRPLSAAAPPPAVTEASIAAQRASSYAPEHVSCIARGAPEAVPITALGIASVVATITATALFAERGHEPGYDHWATHGVILLSSVLGITATLWDQWGCRPSENRWIGITPEGLTPLSPEELRQLGIEGEPVELAQIYREDLPTLRQGLADLSSRYAGAEERARAIAEWIREELPTLVDPRSVAILARLGGQAHLAPSAGGPRTSFHYGPGGVGIRF